MKISTKNTEVLCLFRNPWQFMQQVNGSALQQVEKFKYLGVVFTSDGRRKEEIDKWIGKANAVLRELYRSVVTKQELSKTAKLSVFKSVFVPILTFGHESWVVTEWILFQVHVAEQRWNFCEDSTVWHSGVPMWDGAPMFEPKAFWEKMYRIENQTCDIVRTFRCPQ